MLISFKVSNFLSFDSSVHFVMRAGSGRDFPNHIFNISDGRHGVSVLKSAIIYGANASGKSNFIKAVEFARNLIINGLNDTLTDNKHFRLQKQNVDIPSQFEFEFFSNGKIYAYGVVINLKSRKIVEEWLFEVLKTSDKPIFERTVGEDGKSSTSIHINLKSKEKKRFEVYKIDIKDTQLLLSEINDKNLDDFSNIQSFKDAFDWFKKNLVIIYPNSRYNNLSFIGGKHELKDVFCNLLEEFDTGIRGIETVEQKVDSIIPNDLKEEIQLKLSQNPGTTLNLNLGDKIFTFLLGENGELKAFKLNTKRKINNSNEDASFEIDEESDGTRRMMDLIPALVGLSQNERVFLIDEMDRSLHPELTRKILEVFFNNSVGVASQLIATIHESSLLDLSLVRRDEIWFVEKNIYGASQIYSLEQFKPRHDKEVRKSYLQGRFGAIPFISNVNNIQIFEELSHN